MSAEQHSQIRVLGLREGCKAIVRRLARHDDRGRPLIGITGPVGSGKTTLARLLSEAIGGAVVSTDRYLPDYEQIAPAERDRPEHSDLTRLAMDLAGLKSSGRASVPRWSFHEHRRIGEELITAAGPVICEGIFALHASIRNAMNLRVFVEADAATRWQRWEAIERSGERSWGVDAARRHFETIADPTFEEFEDDYRRSADIVVQNNSQTTAGEA
ncbi:MAG: AAA family ATPase [Planctomycetota bacterium]